MDENNGEGVLRKTCQFNSAPERPVKRGSVQEIVTSRNEFAIEGEESSSKEKSKSDENFDDIIFEDEVFKCYVCQKDITHYNSIRRQQHVNSCVDAQEASSRLEKDTKKWTNTLDCPTCGISLPPGPHRSTHVKVCGKKNGISPRETVVAMGVAEKARQARLKSGIAHTKAEKPIRKEVKPRKLVGEPQSFLDEELQLAKALSMSEDGKYWEKNSDDVKFSRVEDPDAVIRRKRPRSYAIVELAPRQCKCEVVETLQDRFIDNFRMKKTRVEQDKYPNSGYFTTLLQKYARFEQLAMDLRKAADEPPSALAPLIAVECNDGTIQAQRLFLKCRTTLMQRLSSTAASAKIDARKELVQNWLTFVYSAQIEWSHDENEAMKTIADKYGPMGLEKICLTEMRRKTTGEVETKKVDEDEMIEKGKKPLLGPELMSEVPSTSKEVEEFAEQIVKNKEKPMMIGDEIDCEDPLRGTNFEDDPTDIVTEEENLKKDQEKENEEKKAGEDSFEENVIEIVATKEIEVEDVKDRSSTSFDVFSDAHDDVIVENVARESQGPSTSYSLDDVVEEIPNDEVSCDDCEIIEHQEEEEDNPLNEAIDVDVVDNQPLFPDGDEYNYECYNEPMWDPVDDVMYAQPHDDIYGHSLEDRGSSGSKEDSTKDKIIEDIATTPVSRRSFEKRRSSMKTSNEQTVEVEDSFLVPLVYKAPLPIEHPNEVAKTPVTNRPKPVFGSNVKILKTTNITPMPDYDRMDDAQLKMHMKKIGQKPRGRSKAIELLKRAYDITHPLIDPSTPTLRPLVLEEKEEDVKGKKPRQRGKKKVMDEVAEETTDDKQMSQEQSTEVDTDDADADKTLNESREEDAPTEEQIDDCGLLPKDLQGMKQAFLCWLRRPENVELHNHMLSLQPVSLEELLVRLGRSDSSVCGLSKAKLAAVLDDLCISFQLPQNGAPRKAFGGPPKRFGR